jgi:L-lactate dehydrogenase complex protein LldG
MNDKFQIVSKFINAAQNAGATVDKIQSSPEGLYNAVLNAVSDSKRIVMSEPHYIPQSIFKLFRDKADIINQPDAHQLSSAEFGITDAFAGVARTGSVCISVDSGISNYVSLLPETHIVILESKNIVERPQDIFEQFIQEKSKTERGWIFISGPSATADMGELVRGAHGPAGLHIILLD